jgi:hypothetical protein
VGGRYELCSSRKCKLSAHQLSWVLSTPPALGLFRGSKQRFPGRSLGQHSRVPGHYTWTCHEPGPPRALGSDKSAIPLAAAFSLDTVPGQFRCRDAIGERVKLGFVKVPFWRGSLASHSTLASTRVFAFSESCTPYGWFLHHCCDSGVVVIHRFSLQEFPTFREAISIGLTTLEAICRKTRLGPLHARRRSVGGRTAGPELAPSTANNSLTCAAPSAWSLDSS